MSDIEEEVVEETLSLEQRMEQMLKRNNTINIIFIIFFVLRNLINSFIF